MRTAATSILALVILLGCSDSDRPWGDRGEGGSGGAGGDAAGMSEGGGAGGRGARGGEAGFDGLGGDGGSRAGTGGVSSGGGDGGADTVGSGGDAPDAGAGGTAVGGGAGGADGSAGSADAGGGVGLDAGTDAPSCFAEDSHACVGGDIYWFDSCGTQGDLKESCAAGCVPAAETCDVCVGSCSGKQCGDDGCGGECGPCVGAGEVCAAFQCVCASEDSVACDEDLYWVDSCGNRGALKETCPHGCEADACLSACALQDIIQEQADDFGAMAPWQSFRPVTSGAIGTIELRPNAFGGISGELRVYAGVGTGGTLLHSQPYSIASVGSAPWQAFELTASVPVAAGNDYTWELTGANGIYFATSDVYADGRASVSAYDMAMRISPRRLVVDVQQEQADDSAFVAPWQSFTVTRPGTIVAISTRPNAFGGISGDLTIYDGEGVGGDVLHTQSYAIPSVEDAPWQRFELTSAVSVTEGQVLTWELTGANGIYFATSDVYPGGRAGTVPYDMTMRVHVEQCR